MHRPHRALQSLVHKKVSLQTPVGTLVTTPGSGHDSMDTEENTSTRSSVAHKSSIQQNMAVHAEKAQAMFAAALQRTATKRLAKET